MSPSIPKTTRNCRHVLHQRCWQKTSENPSTAHYIGLSVRLFVRLITIRYFSNHSPALCHYTTPSWRDVSNTKHFKAANPNSQTRDTTLEATFSFILLTGFVCTITSNHIHHLFGCFNPHLWNLPRMHCHYISAALQCFQLTASLHAWPHAGDTMLWACWMQPVCEVIRVWQASPSSATEMGPISNQPRP